jgi:hypothetical protein
MLSVSNSFLNSIEANARQILLRANINDTQLIGDDLIDLTVTEAVNASGGLSMGATISSKLVMKIKTPASPLLISGVVKPEVACAGVNEWIPLGEFYITEAVSNDDFETSFTITAYDAFSKTEQPYIPQISMPNTAANILTDIAAQCGFTVSQIPELLNEVMVSQEVSAINGEGTLIFPNGANLESGTLVIGDFVSAPAEESKAYTCRQYIGYFAGLLGKNARFARTGELKFVWYTNSGRTIPRTLQYVGGCKRLTNRDYTVQSITSGSSGAELVAGTGVGISFENPFMTQTILDDIFTNIGKISYTPLQLKWRGNPAIEAGDIIAVEDRSGNPCTVYIMEQTIRVSGGLYSEIKCYGDSESAIAFSTSPTTKKIQQAYTKLQAALAEASALLNGANGGVFEVLDENGDGVNDGWIIHSSDGQKFIKANVNGIGITTNGGGSYKQAITVDGINASVITTGEMSAQRISVGGKALGDVFSVTPDENGHPVVTIGSSDSVIKQKQTNDAITFVNNQDEQVAKFSVTGAEWADLQQMKYCGFVWTRAANGNVRFTKAGEN